VIERGPALRPEITANEVPLPMRVNSPASRVPGQGAKVPVAPTELDRATLLRCREGDPAAFRQFVSRYQRPVMAVLSRLLGPGPEVEDCAQETFIKAHRALPRFDVDGSAKASTWLLTIATRVGLDVLKAKRPAAEPIDAAGQSTSFDSPEQASSRLQLGAALVNAANKLSPEQRASFVLFQFHGFTLDEIADTLQCPRETVKTRLLRARARMRELLQKQLIEELP